MSYIYTVDSPALTATSEDESRESVSSSNSNSGSLSSSFMLPISDNNTLHPEFSRPTRESVLRRLSEALLRRSLIKIDLSQRGLRPADARLVKMALLQNSHVSILKLGYNSLGDQGASILAAGIAQHPALESLDLGFNNIGDEGCQALASAIGSNLHTLYLAGNLIGQDGAMALSDLIRRSTSLSRLYLTGNKLCGEGVSAIADAIVESESEHSNEEEEEEKKSMSGPEENGTSDISCDPTLRGIQELFLGGTDMGKMGSHAVARLLGKSKRLRVLSLTGCDLGDSCISCLASSIKENRECLLLESLQLSFNRMSCQGIEHLSNAIWGLKSLNELRLDNNMIGDSGAQHLAGVLVTLHSLETLDVGFNVIKTRGMMLIMKAVADSQRMKTLSVSGHEFDVNASKALTYAVAFSRSLSALSVVRCDIKPDCKRQIVAGIVSNSQTAMRRLSGFSVGPVLVSLGFPTQLEHWSNEQVFNFVHLMWSKENEEDTSMDPLNFLDEDQRKPTPVEASIVVELAKKTFSSLVENGLDVFSKPSESNLNADSPLVGDSIMVESIHVVESDQQQAESETISWGEKTKSFVAEPESISSEAALPDPARKQRIVEWLCQNIPHLKKLGQLPFSSSELGRLHQYYFAPVVNESGGGAPNLPPDLQAKAANLSAMSNGSHGAAVGTLVSDTAIGIAQKEAQSNGITSLPTMMKRKVSYRNLGDATLASAPRLESGRGNATSFSPSVSRAGAGNTNSGNAVTLLIEKGAVSHSLPPKSKRARRNRSRISFLPKVKRKLDSYLDVCHEKALHTMRQLFYVEQAIMSGQVNPIDPTKTARTHLCGDFAADADTIIVDMM